MLQTLRFRRERAGLERGPPKYYRASKQVQDPSGLPGGWDLRIPTSAKGGSEVPGQDGWGDRQTDTHTHT